MRAILRRLRVSTSPPRSPAEIFSAIYAGKHWGGAEHDFYSGSGSHEPSLIEPYVAAMRGWLASRPTPPVVVDLGCGDFAAASRWVDLAAHYRGCDVVPALIERNRRLWSSPRVIFHLLDAVTDPLPPGDVVIVKQVLQHLSNVQIAAILTRLSVYPRWVITEHVPSGRFVANHDMPTSGYTRLQAGSGVVLTEPPFSIAPLRTTVLCEVPDGGNPVRTVVYEF